MRCEHVQDRLLESLMEGAEDPPVGLKPHLDQCAHCRAEFERLRRGLAVARKIPHLAVDPPPGMKQAVMEAILAPAPEAAPLRQPKPREPLRTSEAGSWLAHVFRGMVVRPLPIAAAMCVLFLGALGVYAGQRISKSRDANVVVQKVNDSPALRNLDSLERVDWIAEKELHRTAILETKLQLQRIAEGADDPKAVESALNAIRNKRLIAAFRTLENDAPATAEGDASAKMVSEVRMLLEDIVNRDS